MADTWMSPEAVVARKYAQELLTDRHGHLAQYLPMVVTDWKSVDKLNLGGRATSAEVSFPLSNGEEQFVLVLRLAKIGREWRIISFEFKNKEGESITTQNETVRVSVLVNVCLVQSAYVRSQMVSQIERHDLYIPARYEHLLYNPVGEPVWAGHREYFEEIWTVPFYVDPRGQYRHNDILLGTQIFDYVPTEDGVVKALLVGQKALWEAIEAQRLNAARFRGDFRSSRNQVKGYLNIKSAQIWERKLEEDRLPDHPARQQQLMRPRVNRLIAFARWLIAEYGEYNPETGYTSVFIPATAMNEAGHVFKETRVYVNDTYIGLEHDGRGFEMQKMVPQGGDTPLWGIADGATYRCLSPIEWTMPELEYAFPGINQAAFEFATALDADISNGFDVIWLDTRWVDYALDHVG